jgi:hypothetical protein
MEFRKYGQKNAYPVSVPIPRTFVPQPVPFSDFSENMKMIG